MPGPAAFSDALARAVAIQLLSLEPASAERGERGRPLDPRRLRTVISYIDAHLDENLTLDRLARETGLKRSHFASAFRLATGQSPRQYVIRRRVDAARELLSARAGPISEIAYRTGFAHQSHLSRAIRKLTGMTPRELTTSGPHEIGEPARAPEGPATAPGRGSAENDRHLEHAHRSSRD